ncbi:MAG: ATP-binding cassette domain-containing protein [Acidobacteria bacterium]|nr:ATP-binding cassette domain-containing protein [Acidobacteriota bacterium]
MIEVRDISKIYSSVTVLDGVSFRIADRSITSFVGPNGAGKTTLLGIISRLIKPDGGEVLLDEKSISEYGGSDLAKRISILKQSNFVNMRLTVRELIGFGRFPHSGGRLTGEDKDMVERAVEYLDLAEMAEKDINELSGGQRQRAFIGMIVAQDTDHILLDEPLNSLDMRHSVEMMRILRRLTDELKKTVVLVLHDINFAARYSDRMVALKNGKVAALGSVDEVVREDVLASVFDVPLEIREIDGKKICIYY